ncbi:MAG: nucleoside hydrolase [Acidimicrobiia bacterium]|nr:nucleoside hydrolase [Acidimicrobiia bacterium]
MRRIVIDTDPGQDDAVALLAALASPELEVVAVTTVAGNVPLSRTTANALAMVELAGRPEVPVYAGCARPMVRRLVTAEYVHGPTGIDGADLPAVTLAATPGNAVDALIDLLTRSEATTVCLLGPHTNLAMAMVKEPSITAHIDEIVLMGGGFFEGGNTTPAAEFNIYVDPHAAQVVFTSGVPITMMPLDVTHQALTTDARIARFRALGTPAGEAVAGMLDFYDRHDEAKYGTEGGPLHDPCVIAYLLRPELFTGRRCHVAIEHHSELTMGMTVIDWWGVTGNEPNAQVMNQVDADGYYELLTDRIGRIHPVTG